MQDTYLGKEIPKLGFGLMRLPMKDGAVDLELTKKWWISIWKEDLPISTPLMFT